MTTEKTGSVLDALAMNDKGDLDLTGWTERYRAANPPTEETPTEGKRPHFLERVAAHIERTRQEALAKGEEPPHTESPLFKEMLAKQRAKDGTEE